MNDILFAAFHDELEKLSSYKTTTLPAAGPRDATVFDTRDASGRLVQKTKVNPTGKVRNFGPAGRVLPGRMGGTMGRSPVGAQLRQAQRLAAARNQQMAQVAKPASSMSGPRARKALGAFKKLKLTRFI